MANGPTSTKFGGWLKGLAAVGLCLISGVIGGALTRHVGTTNFTLSYADFVSIMLTAISVLMTVLAIFLAVAGFVGWTTIEQKVHSKTEEYLARGLEEGGRLESMVVGVIERKTENYLARGLEKGGQLESIVIDVIKRKTEGIMFDTAQEVGDEDMDEGT